jgi:hypothetical protein
MEFEHCPGTGTLTPDQLLHSAGQQKDRAVSWSETGRRYSPNALWCAITYEVENASDHGGLLIDYRSVWSAAWPACQKQPTCRLLHRVHTIESAFVFHWSFPIGLAPIARRSLREDRGRLSRRSGLAAIDSAVNSGVSRSRERVLCRGKDWREGSRISRSAQWKHCLPFVVGTRPAAQQAAFSESRRSARLGRGSLADLSYGGISATAAASHMDRSHRVGDCRRKIANTNGGSPTGPAA